MGNYLTKIKDLIAAVMPTLERTKAKKRKRVDFEHDFEEALLREDINEGMINSAQTGEDGLATVEAQDNEAENGAENGESDLVTNGVSLSQLNSIMNRMNQPDVVSSGSGGSEGRETIRSSDLESVLFSRNRLASLQ